MQQLILSSLSFSPKLPQLRRVKETLFNAYDNRKGPEQKCKIMDRKTYAECTYVL